MEESSLPPSIAAQMVHNGVKREADAIENMALTLEESVFKANQVGSRGGGG